MSSISLKDLSNNKKSSKEAQIVVEVRESAVYEASSAQKGYLTRVLDSFKKPETVHLSQDDVECMDYDSVNGKHKDLKQRIKPRHVLMMSLATGIGTGLLVGNGKALHFGGPGGVIIAYVIISSMLYCVMQSASELAVSYTSLAGGFSAYPSLLIDRGFGFAVTWVYCIQWLSVLPLELVAATITIKYWTNSINPDVYVAIFYVLLVVINFIGPSGYAEAEFFFNMCKVLTICGFFILGIIIDCGGVGNSGYIGFRYWHNPGAFAGETFIDHFKSITAILVIAAFAYGGVEFSVLSAAEHTNPRKSISSFCKRLLWRIMFIYIGTSILIGLLVPYVSDELLGSSGSTTHASPFVIAIASHGIKVIPHFINAVILISVLSVGNSALYSSSRILLSLAEQGYAPKFLKYIDRRGRPVFTLLVSCIAGCLSFVAASPHEDTIFTWLLSISGLSELFTWLSIALSHIRFRKAMEVQNRSLDELGYKSLTGIWGSYYSIFLICLVLIAQFWVAIIPIGENKPNVISFFENYLAMPLLIILYFGYKIWTKEWVLYYRAEEIDLVSHRKIFDPEVLREEELEEKLKMDKSSFVIRIYNFWC